MDEVSGVVKSVHHEVFLGSLEVVSHETEFSFYNKTVIVIPCAMSLEAGDYVVARNLRSAGGCSVSLGERDKYYEGSISVIRGGIEVYSINLIHDSKYKTRGCAAGRE